MPASTYDHEYDARLLKTFSVLNWTLASAIAASQYLI